MEIFIFILLCFLILIVSFISWFEFRKYRISNQKFKKAKLEADIAKLKLMSVQKGLKTIVDLMSD